MTPYRSERGVPAERGEVAAGVAVGERGEARQLVVAERRSRCASRQHAPHERHARAHVWQRHVYALREPSAGHKSLTYFLSKIVDICNRDLIIIGLHFF